MEIKINREALLKAVTRVQGILEKRSHMPILSTVLMTAKDNTVELSATDLEVSYRNTYPAEVTNPGSITISGKKLMDITRETNRKNILIIEKENNWIYISDGSAQYNISSLPADEFPVLTEPEDVLMMELDAYVLTEMIENTIYAITSEETGFKLSGVYVEKNTKKDEEFLRMVSTDGHRLSLVEKKVPDLKNLEMTQPIMIPRKGLVELNRLCLENGKVSIGLKQNNLVAKKNKSLVVIRLLDAKFPDYENVIPPEPEKISNVAKVDRKLLLESIKRMMIIRDDQHQDIRLLLSSDYLEIKSVNPDTGNASEKIEADYSGEQMEISFNPKYFIEALQPMRSNDVMLTIKDQKSPCLISGKEDTGFLGLIMPMKY